MGKSDFKVGRVRLDNAVRRYKRGETALLPGIQECFSLFREPWGKQLAGQGRLSDGVRKYDRLLIRAINKFKPYTRHNSDTDLLGSRFNEYFCACLLNKIKQQVVRRRAQQNMAKVN
jgi:hypothetical protein